jgi:hypothetical protein
LPWYFSPFKFLYILPQTLHPYNIFDFPFTVSSSFWPEAEADTGADADAVEEEGLSFFFEILVVANLGSVSGDCPSEGSSSDSRDILNEASFWFSCSWPDRSETLLLPDPSAVEESWEDIEDEEDWDWDLFKAECDWLDAAPICMRATAVESKAVRPRAANIAGSMAAKGKRPKAGSRNGTPDIWLLVLLLLLLMLDVAEEGLFWLFEFEVVGVVVELKEGFVIPNRWSSESWIKFVVVAVVEFIVAWWANVEVGTVVLRDAKADAPGKECKREAANISLSPVTDFRLPDEGPVGAVRGDSGVDADGILVAESDKSLYPIFADADKGRCCWFWFWCKTDVTFDCKDGGGSTSWLIFALLCSRGHERACVSFVY